MAQQSTRLARSEATRGRLLKSARRLFAKRGYAAVGTNEVVAAARTTRGGLYYHFKDKRDLFRAVYEQVEADLAAEIATKLGEAGAEPLRMLELGVSTFLDACTRPDVAQIALIDAPSVLGWQEWREVDAKHGLGLVSAGLELAIAAGVLQRQPVEPLAHLLLGAMGEAGMMIANDANPTAARRRVEPALLSLLHGLRAPGS
jgi:AcrR family transcriptional regulator